MATIPQVMNTSSSSVASDLLRSSSNGISGVPLKALGRVRLGAISNTSLGVVAKLRKGKKHDYPWPKDADENIKGGVLTHLSHFKPLKDKPKPVTLDFEKPLMDLERKIIDVRKMATETGLDFSDQIMSLENKYHQALKDLYTHLTPIQRVSIARHPNRPTFLDHIFNITDKWVELHGDRAGYDDPAIVTGVGSINGRRYMFMGHQKGRNTKENIQRNFGMPTPHGYRKALRMMRYADHHGFPIVTFIDTPGAYADLKSEELGQGEAIAHNLREMFGLKVPIVSIVIGEGGSGGALAIGCGNKLLMLENAVFYVASPEACAAILWKTAKAAPKAAEKLKITATELCKLKICDGIIPEPLGGAHADSSWTSKQIKIAITEAMDELLKMDTKTLLEHRHQKFRHLGGFQEGIPQDPIKKVNMKKNEEPIIQEGEVSITPDSELEEEIEKLKQKILKAGNSSTKPPQLGVNEMIEKLKREIAMEHSAAVDAMGLKENLKVLREEYMKARSSANKVDPALIDKIDKLSEEFSQGLSKAPNYGSLKYRVDMLKELSKAKALSEQNIKLTNLKQDVNKKFVEFMNQSDVKEKMKALKTEAANAESSDGNLDHGLKEKALKVKKEIELQWANVLKSLNLNVEHIVPKAKDFTELPSLPELKVKIEEMDEEIQKEMSYAIQSTDLRNKLELLKLEVMKAGKKPNPDMIKKIESLQKQIKENLVEALSSSSGLIQKHEELKADIAQAVESSGGMNGVLKQDALIEDEALIN
ncbi:hypothetical protein IFM89_028066 [Coptis chinensis]|uniref:acetyl-CoA carboxytransferase n=1 Tax=Coptis chinensis TaxID=261450 RepID=A0A835HHM8_9MAGN|nr:hypothetical protein IFM89_028066 [Coptis chinensis]